VRNLSAMAKNLMKNLPPYVETRNTAVLLAGKDMFAEAEAAYKKALCVAAVSIASLTAAFAL
jgi:hypothetical protein